MISVIVVTYNQEKTIGRTLDSILSQRLDEELEIIVGDDCSTDGTRRVCEEYARRYPDKIRYLRREQNLGVVANYYDCIRQARGEYLADCAGDDFWIDPDKLQRQHDFLESHPEVTLVATDWLCCDPDGKNVRRSPSRPEVCETEIYEPDTIGGEILTSTITPHLCSAMYRRDLIVHELDRNPELMAPPGGVFEDMPIMLACARAGRIAILPGVTLHYCVVPDSISNPADSGRRFDYILAATTQSLRLAEGFGIPAAKLEGYMKRRIDHLAHLAFASRDSQRFRRLQQFRKSSGHRGSFKSSIYDMICAHPLVWKAALAIKKQQ